MKILVRYKDAPLADIWDLMVKFKGYFDADSKSVIFPFNQELAEELENRGIMFMVGGDM